MSEKMYAWLLRFYPSHFREAFGDEALQLFRDRARDEQGFFPALRLWLDLLSDFLTSVPREYWRAKPHLVDVPARPHGKSIPALHVFEAESPHLGALLFDGVLSLIALGAIAILLVHAGPSMGAQAAAFGQFSNYSRFHGRRTPPPPEAAFSMSCALVEDSRFDAAERQRVIDAVAAKIQQHYVDPSVGQKMADMLLAHEKAGDYEAVTDGAAWAHLLTRQMREVSSDMHMEMVFSERPLPIPRIVSDPEVPASYRRAMEESNCTFEAARILPHNIGYLKLNSFPDTRVCRQTAVDAMARLNGADAIIFDLRDNRGGYPNMVQLIAAYLFDHPEYWFSPRENTTEQSWTQSPVPGNRLVDKPAYVLTSTRTFSGAEQFCYDLKMLKRATLVGETTGGAAHAGVFYRIDDHFGVAIYEVRPINPFSKTDWEGTGVEPDVKVTAADALSTARKLAESELRMKDSGAKSK